MTPERMAELVARWVRFYTRDLPPPIAERRIEEIDADVHDHIAHDRAHGSSDRRIAVGILSRMVRGVAADASWRGKTIANLSTRKDAMNPRKIPYRSAVRVGIATACVLLLPLVAMQISDEFNWDAFDFVAAGVLVAGAGALLELAARKPRNVIYMAAATALGLLAIVAGERDDAPGLVLFGGLLIVGTVGLAVRAAQRNA